VLQLELTELIAPKKAAALARAVAVALADEASADFLIFDFL